VASAVEEYLNQSGGLSLQEELSQVQERAGGVHDHEIELACDVEGEA
jgi:hypothetical protein